MVLVVVEVDDAEERKPGAGVWRSAVHELEGRREMAVDLDRDLVHHPTRMLDGVEPVVAWHLRFGEVGAAHRAHGLPRALGQAVGGLAACGGPDDLGLLLVDPATSVAPQELLVAVAAELLGKRAGVGAELLESLDDVVGEEVLEAVEPGVLRCAVHQQQGVAEAEAADGVAVDDVEVDLVEVALGGLEDLAAAALAKVGELTDGWAGLASLDELRVLGGGAEVAVVAEAAVAEEAVDLLRGEVEQRVGGACCVARAHVRGGCVGVGGEEAEGLGGDAAGGRRLSREEVKSSWVDALCLELAAGLAPRRGGGSSWLSAVLGGVRAEVDVAVDVPGHTLGAWVHGRRRSGRQGRDRWRSHRRPVGGRVEAAGAARRGGSGGRAGSRGARLDVVKHLRAAADGVARDDCVHLVVDVQSEAWEDADDAVVVAVEAAALDATVDAEAEEREAEVGDVVDVADGNGLAPHDHCDGADAVDGNCLVVGERDHLVRQLAVGSEGLVVGPQVVGCSAVEDGHCS